MDKFSGFRVFEIRIFKKPDGDGFHGKPEFRDKRIADKRSGPNMGKRPARISDGHDLQSEVTSG